MKAITYTSKEELQQSLEDLRKTKEVASEQLRNILAVGFKKISKRSMMRILDAMASYPTPPKIKLTTAEERAVLEHMMGIMEIQLYMMMMAIELSESKEESNDKETDEEVQDGI